MCPFWSQDEDYAYRRPRRLPPRAIDVPRISVDDPIPSIRSIGWNPLGTLIATGAADKTLRVCKWINKAGKPYFSFSSFFPVLTSSTTGNPEKALIRYSTELKGHTAPIEKVAFNPVKDAELCSVSNDGVVKFWDVRTKNCINEVKGLGDTFTLAWDPEGESLIVGNKVSEAGRGGGGNPDTSFDLSIDPLANP